MVGGRSWLRQRRAFLAESSSERSQNRDITAAGEVVIVLDFTRLGRENDDVVSARSMVLLC